MRLAAVFTLDDKVVVTIKTDPMLSNIREDFESSLT